MIKIHEANDGIILFNYSFLLMTLNYFLKIIIQTCILIYLLFIFILI